jgi:hypothetical protein
MGWRAVDKDRLKTILAAIATSCTGNKTRSMTIEDHIRRRAWETALSAGITTVADWVASILEKTSSPFERRDALSLASFLRLDTWPSSVEQLVRSGLKVEDRSGDTILDRTAAVDLLYATDRKEALRVLLNSCIMINDSPLRSTTEAVADLAARLARNEREFVLSELLAACESRELGNRRMLAVAALQRLAATNAIPTSELGRLVSIAQDDSMPAYATAGMIWTLGCFPESVTTAGVLQLLLSLIDDAETDLDVKFQSLQALVHLEAWGEYAQRFKTALGLQEGGNGLNSDDACSIPDVAGFPIGTAVHSSTGRIPRTCKERFKRSPRRCCLRDSSDRAERGRRSGPCRR